MHGGAQRCTGVHRGAQGCTGVHRGAQGYKGVQRGTKGCKGVQGLAGRPSYEERNEAPVPASPPPNVPCMPPSAPIMSPAPPVRATARSIPAAAHRAFPARLPSARAAWRCVSGSCVLERCTREATAPACPTLTCTSGSSVKRPKAAAIRRVVESSRGSSRACQIREVGEGAKRGKVEVGAKLRKVEVGAK